MIIFVDDYYVVFMILMYHFLVTLPSNLLNIFIFIVTHFNDKSRD